MLYCEQLGEQPDPTNIPIRYDDLDHCARVAWGLFDIARTQVIMSPVGVVGISVSAICALLELYSVSIDDRKDVFEHIYFMFNYVETRMTEPDNNKEAINGVTEHS